MLIFRRSKLYFYSIWYRHSLWAAVHCTGWERTHSRCLNIKKKKTKKLKHCLPNCSPNSRSGCHNSDYNLFVHVRIRLVVVSECIHSFFHSWSHATCSQVFRRKHNTILPHHWSHKHILITSCTVGERITYLQSSTSSCRFFQQSH
jgi:hypothetical protein